MADLSILEAALKTFRQVLDSQPEWVLLALLLGIVIGLFSGVFFARHFGSGFDDDDDDAAVPDKPKLD